MQLMILQAKTTKTIRKFYFYIMIPYIYFVPILPLAFDVRFNKSKIMFTVYLM